MIDRQRATLSALLVISMLLAGCNGAETETAPSEVPGCMNENAENFDPEATVSDESCEYKSSVLSLIHI